MRHLFLFKAPFIYIFRELQFCIDKTNIFQKSLQTFIAFYIEHFYEIITQKHLSFTSTLDNQD